MSTYHGSGAALYTAPDHLELGLLTFFYRELTSASRLLMKHCKTHILFDKNAITSLSYFLCALGFCISKTGGSLESSNS
jgi:hypothetical protein